MSGVRSSVPAKRTHVQSGRNITLAMTAFAFTACASTPAPEATGNAEFVWGCWVAKDAPGGRALSFLRLLKDGPEGRSYRGYLHDVRGDEMIPVLRLTVLRDGMSAAVVKDGDITEFASNGPQGHSLQFISSTPDKTGRLEITGGNDRLSLGLQLGSEGFAYTFERDGCD